MNNTECKLQMLDLYFSKYSFWQERKDDNKEYDSSFEIDYAINKEDDSKIKVTINTLVKNQTESFSLELQAIGIFRIDKNEMDNSVYEHLVKVNTVAIIFPFIRSQISLLTTQPGMTPVMLQPINFSALIKE